MGSAPHLEFGLLNLNAGAGQVLGPKAEDCDEHFPEPAASHKHFSSRNSGCMSLRTTSPLWAKLTLKRLRALPELGQEISILHSTVGSAMLKAWSVTYADKPDASAWAYCDVNSGEKEPTRVAPGWLEKIIRNLGASDHDSDVDAVLRAIQKNVVYNRRMPTTAVVAEWTLSIATVEDTMPEGVLAAADPRAL